MASGAAEPGAPPSSLATPLLLPDLEAQRSVGEDTTPAAGMSFRGADSEALHRSSSRLLRTASRVLGGTALVRHDESEAAPDEAERPVASRGSLRRQHTNTVQQRIFQETWTRFRIRISLFILLLVAMTIVMCIVYMQALWAFLWYDSLPCDQPLGIYFAATFAVGQFVSPWIKTISQSASIQQNPRMHFLIAFLNALPGWIVVSWGLYMVNVSKTCAITAPQLFYPTRRFIYSQLAVSAIVSVGGAFGLRGLLRAIEGIKQRSRQSCEKAAKALPKVDFEAEELLDPEDGKLMECPICTEAFAPPKDVVRTECEHHFHEECLSRWCKNHLDCPMCRAQVGPPDEPSTTEV